MRLVLVYVIFFSLHIGCELLLQLFIGDLVVNLERGANV
jgi:hypothetical protein